MIANPLGGPLTIYFSHSWELVVAGYVTRQAGFAVALPLLSIIFTASCCRCCYYCYYPRDHDEEVELGDHVCKAGCVQEEVWAL